VRGAIGKGRSNTQVMEDDSSGLFRFPTEEQERRVIENVDAIVPPVTSFNEFQQYWTQLSLNLASQYEE